MPLVWPQDQLWLATAQEVNVGKRRGQTSNTRLNPGLRGLCPVWNQMPANYYQFQRQQTLANYQHRTTIQSQHSRAGLGWIVLEKTRVFRALEVPAAAASNARRHLWSWNAFSSVHVLTLPTPKGKIWLFSCLMLPYYHQILVSLCSLVLSRYCTFLSEETSGRVINW